MIIKLKSSWTKYPDPLGMGEEARPDVKSDYDITMISCDLVWGEIGSTPDDSILVIECSDEVGAAIRADNRFTEVTE